MQIARCEIRYVAGHSYLLMDSTIQFPIEVGYKIVQNLAVIEQVSLQLTAEMYQLAEQYGVDPYKAQDPSSPEYSPEFCQAYDRLLAETIEVPILTFSYDLIADLPLSLQQLRIISLMIK